MEGGGIVEGVRGDFFMFVELVGFVVDVIVVVMMGGD